MKARQPLLIRTDRRDEGRQGKSRGIDFSCCFHRKIFLINATKKRMVVETRQRL